MLLSTVSVSVRICQRVSAAFTNSSNSERNSPVRQKFSGCHCTAMQKRARGALDRFDDAIGRGRGDVNPSRGLLDGLVMAAVDLQHFAVGELFLHDARERACRA